MVLLFGCRSQEDDFYYADEWDTMRSQGANLTVISAFSRENPTEGKTYVQHKIREQGDLLADLILNQNAMVYVSGRAKFMPKSVEKAFTDIVGTAMGVTDKE